MSDSFTKAIEISDASFSELSSLLSEYSKNADDSTVKKALETGAKEFVTILLKLPSPKSKINKSGYTHMIDSFKYQSSYDGYEVGWGKYYGLMVENGTTKMKAQAHLKPCWSTNKETVYKKIIEKLNF